MKYMSIRFYVLILGATVLLDAGCSSKNSPTSTPNNFSAPSLYSQKPETAITQTPEDNPSGISYYDGHLWVAFDRGGATPYLGEYNTSGQSITVIDTFNGNSKFFGSTDVKTGPDGTVYVADSDNNRIDVFSSSGAYQTAITGLSYGRSVVVNSSGTTLYALDGTPAIQVYKIDNFTKPKTFTYVGILGTISPGVNASCEPFYLAIDSNGNVYVSIMNENYSPNMYYSSILKYSPTIGSTPVSFSSSCTNPEGIVVDHEGNVFMSCYSPSNYVQEFTPLENTYTAGVTFGNGILDYPIGLTLDESENLYVADSGHSRILEYKRESLRGF